MVQAKFEYCTGKLQLRWVYPFQQLQENSVFFHFSLVLKSILRWLSCHGGWICCVGLNHTGTVILNGNRQQSNLLEFLHTQKKMHLPCWYTKQNIYIETGVRESSLSVNSSLFLFLCCFYFIHEHIAGIVAYNLWTNLFTGQTHSMSFCGLYSCVFRLFPSTQKSHWRWNSWYSRVRTYRQQLTPHAQ